MFVVFQKFFKKGPRVKEAKDASPGESEVSPAGTEPEMKQSTHTPETSEPSVDGTVRSFSLREDDAQKIWDQAWDRLKNDEEKRPLMEEYEKILREQLKSNESPGKICESRNIRLF